MDGRLWKERQSESDMRNYGTITNRSEQAVLMKKAVKEHFFLCFLVLIPFSAHAESIVYALVQCTITVPDIPASSGP